MFSSEEKTQRNLRVFKSVWDHSLRLFYLALNLKGIVFKESVEFGRIS